MSNGAACFQLSLVVLVAACAAGPGCSDTTNDSGENLASTPDVEPDAAVRTCGSWRAGPRLLDRRESAGAVMLSDGRILLVGGHFLPGGVAVDSSEILDVQAFTSTLAASYVNRHTSSGGALQLAGGPILSGDSWVTHLETTPTELYDLAADRWTVAGAMNLAGGGTVALADGRALAAGGIDWSVDVPTARTETFDPATGVWTLGAEMTSPRVGHALLNLGDDVLAIGGHAAYPSDEGVQTSEIWDAGTETWGRVAHMVESRTAPAVTLTDGRVLTAGGSPASGGNRPELRTSELYDPKTNTWSPAGQMREGRKQHALVVLADGRVLATGGGYAQNVSSDRSSAELYDPETDTWSFAGEMARARRNHAAIALPSGEAIIIGGYNRAQLDSTEIYTPCER